MRELNETEASNVSGAGWLGALVGGAVGAAIGSLTFTPVVAVGAAFVCAKALSDVEDKYLLSQR